MPCTNGVVAMMRPPDKHLTPDEFDDSRFVDSYWGAAVTLLIPLVVLVPSVLTRWYGWTGARTAPVVGLLILVWAATSTLVYVIWARARRRRRRRGGR